MLTRAPRRRRRRWQRPQRREARLLSFNTQLFSTPWYASMHPFVWYRCTSSQSPSSASRRYTSAHSSTCGAQLLRPHRVATAAATALSCRRRRARGSRAQVCEIVVGGGGAPLHVVDELRRRLAVLGEEVHQAKLHALIPPALHLRRAREARAQVQGAFWD